MWRILANHCAEAYSSYVDMESEFFQCPNCGEPIYSDDFENDDYCLGGPYTGLLFCPICGDLLFEEDEVKH